MLDKLTSDLVEIIARFIATPKAGRCPPATDWIVSDGKPHSMVEAYGFIDKFSRICKATRVDSKLWQWWFARFFTNPRDPIKVLPADPPFDAPSWRAAFCVASRTAASLKWRIARSVFEHMACWNLMFLDRWHKYAVYHKESAILIELLAHVRGAMNISEAYAHRERELSTLQSLREMFVLIRDDDVAGVERLLCTGLNPNATRTFGINVDYLASATTLAAKSTPKMLELVVSFGGDVNRMVDGSYPIKSTLFRSPQSERLVLFKALVEVYDYHIHLKDFMNRNVLWLTCKMGTWAEAEFLLHHTCSRRVRPHWVGEFANVQDDHYKLSPLMLVAREGRLDHVKHLISLGADARARDATGNYAIDLRGTAESVRPWGMHWRIERILSAAMARPSH